MPLLDHFHPPLSKLRHWDSFHGAWAEAMAIHLNQKLLPQRYYAEARVTVGNRVEIDVATLEETKPESDGGGVSVWTPAKPRARVPLDFANVNEFEVQVINDAEGPRVVAAVELVSPANKDRPLHRRLFTAKCASYLQQSVSVIVVDVVTERTSNLQADLLELLELSVAIPGQAAGELYAAAYRTLADRDQAMHLEVWADLLTLGADLPTLPLWISPEQSVPLDLEQTYRVACANRRIAV
jgi:hypothetical protein